MIGLRVELWNGYAVHVLAWKDDAAPPCVILRGDADVHAGAERDLADQTAASFRAWLDRAQGRGTSR